MLPEKIQYFPWSSPTDCEMHSSIYDPLVIRGIFKVFLNRFVMMEQEK